MRQPISILNNLLQWEILAVTAYAEVNQDCSKADLMHALRKLQNNHQERLFLLRDEINKSAETPAEAPKQRGSLYKLWKVRTVHASEFTVSAVSKGEQEITKIYKEAGEHCQDTKLKALIEETLLSMQLEAQALAESLHARDSLDPATEDKSIRRRNL